MEDNNCFIIRNLSFSYGEKEVLHELSLNIPKGKIVTLMGANGCGKSTLFQLLTKNLKTKSGDIWFEKKNIEQMSLRDFSKKVAIVHQNNSAPGDLTVEQLVSYGRIPFTKKGRSISKERDLKMIERALKITGTAGLRDKSIQALSGGQRQRVWIAMAIAQGTKTLLLDEPTTYLDVRYQLQILKLVKLLNQKLGISIIMVLHDINQALYYSDEIIALSTRGTMVTQGKPNDVITSDTIKKIYGIHLETMNYNGRNMVLTV